MNVPQHTHDLYFPIPTELSVYSTHTADSGVGLFDPSLSSLKTAKFQFRGYDLDKAAIFEFIGIK